jgi:AMP-binding enzyme
MDLTKENQLEFYQYSIKNSRDFYITSCQKLAIIFKGDFKLTKENICDATNPKYPKWFTGAQMNITDSLLKMVKIQPDKTFLYYRSEIDNGVKKISYGELDTLASKFASGLVLQGLKEGDYAGLCSAGMNLESTVAYIGCLKAGVVPVCLLPQQNKAELELKIAELDKPLKLLITQDFGNKDITNPHPLYEYFCAGYRHYRRKTKKSGY